MPLPPIHPGEHLAEELSALGLSAAALARASAACASSFSKQQCLYLRPEPQ